MAMGSVAPFKSIIVQRRATTVPVGRSEIHILERAYWFVTLKVREEATFVAANIATDGPLCGSALEHDRCFVVIPLVSHSRTLYIIRMNGGTSILGIQKHMIQFSLKDTIGMLDASPAKADLIPEVTVIQVMNRAPIAHLAIERTLKFLIHAAGGNFEETHTLNRHREALEDCDPKAEDYLACAFDEAVRFYRYNTNAVDLKHLRSLSQYFHETGTDDAFQKMRYWELGQSLQDVLIRRIDLRIHREILYALRQLLMTSDDHTPKTITHRVDTLIKQPILVNMEYEKRLH